MENGQTRVFFDFTSIKPAHSGGVEEVAYGLLEGFSALGSKSPVQPEVLVQKDSLPEWRELGGAPFELRGHASFLNADARWQTSLRRLGRAPAPLVGLLRNLRARSTARVTADALTYYPFHRVPARAENYVVTLHDMRVFQAGMESSLDQKIIRENVVGARAVICSWPHPYQEARRLFPDATEKIHLIPLPVFHAPATRPSRHRLLGGQGSSRLLYPAGLAPHKNHENLIRGLALVTRPVTLVCTGPGADEERLRLERLALDLGCRVEFKGRISAAELRRQFEESDALIIPTLWEAASGPLFEALAWGKPVLASRIEPVESQLQFANASALLFDPRSAESIAAAIESWVEEGAPVNDNVAGWIWGRHWEDVAIDYARVLLWAAGKADKPTHLQPELSKGGPK